MQWKFTSLVITVPCGPLQARIRRKLHRTPFVECADGVVYEVPLSCGKQYIGQTGRCLNDWLRERRLNVSDHLDSPLSVPCHDCGSVTLFESCVVRARHKNRFYERLEADVLIRAGSTCVSVPSLSPTDKESVFPRMAATRGCWRWEGNKQRNIYAHAVQI